MSLEPSIMEMLETKLSSFLSLLRECKVLLERIATALEKKKP